MLGSRCLLVTVAGAALCLSWAPASVTAVGTQLGGTVAPNFVPAVTVVNRQATEEIATSPQAMAARISSLSATPGSMYDVNVVSQTSAAPAPGYTSTTTLELLDPKGLQYQIGSQLDGSVTYQRSTDGGLTWTNVGAASLTTQDQSTHIVFPDGPATVAGTTMWVKRVDLRDGQNGFETATSPVRLDSLVGLEPPNTTFLSPIGRIFGPNGLTNTSCTIANAPTQASLDPATNSVSFYFDQPPSPDVRLTVGAPDYSSLTLWTNIYGNATDTAWKGVDQRVLPPIPLAGDFPATLNGRVLKISTTNPTVRLFDPPYAAWIIGVVDKAECYSISAAVPLSTLATQSPPAPAVPVALPPTTVPATTVPATTVPATTVPATTVPATSNAPTTVVTVRSSSASDNAKNSSYNWGLFGGGVFLVLGTGGFILFGKRRKAAGTATEPKLPEPPQPTPTPPTPPTPEERTDQRDRERNRDRERSLERDGDREPPEPESSHTESNPGDGFDPVPPPPPPPPPPTPPREGEIG